MRRALILILVILLTACSDGSDREYPLSMPIADAGHSMTLSQYATAVLDGSGSYDPSGNPLTFNWRILSQPTGSTSDLSDTTSPYPSLYLDSLGDYEIQLIVNNGSSNSAPVTVKISDTDSIPVANAGYDRKVDGTNPITLNGSLSFDTDGDQLSYQWTMVSSPSGSLSKLIRANSPYPILIPDSSGTYTFELVVSDGSNTSLPDTVIVTDQNITPVANAGTSTTFVTGRAVNLNASRSFDMDGDNLTFQWLIVSAPTNSTATLLNSTSVIASITPDVSGDYIISLVVNDGKTSSPVTSVTLHSDNQPPLANAGRDLISQIGQLVHLDGSGSTDADGDPLEARWSFVSKPKNSASILADIHTLQPTFIPDSAGDYVVQLIVYDGHYFSIADTVTISTNNLAPTAHAGANQTVITGQQFNLDGSQSTDPEGSSLTYIWSEISSPQSSTATLSSTTAVTPSFTPDVSGHYVFQLIVSDGSHNSLPATVVISDSNLPPIAEAGPDQSVATSYMATLDGTMSIDPESQPLSYRWVLLSNPIGSTAVIINSNNAIASLIPDRIGDYVVQLTVEDSDGQKKSDVLIIRDSVSNTIPVADAGTDLRVDLGTNIVLDGSGSFDADGDPLHYTWSMVSRPSGSTAQLVNNTTRNPNFLPDVDGDFIIQLVVSDTKSTSLPDTIIIHDTKKNLQPKAHISAASIGVTLTTVSLDGSQSSDPNGDALSYHWTILSQPVGSGATLNDTTLAMPHFTPDIAGNYLIALQVNDGLLTSSPISKTITVNDPAKGSAIPLPSGHNLMMISATGGESGTGALISLRESYLSQSTEIISFHGVPGFFEKGPDQSLVAHPNTMTLYSLQSETGVFGSGAIFTLDPKTQALQLFTSIPNFNINGNRIRFADSKLLFHPDGKSLYAYSKLGGVNNAGLLLHINTDSANANYKDVSVIGEIGESIGSFTGSVSSGHSNLMWNGPNKLLLTFGFSRLQPSRPVIEFTASDASDLAQPWQISIFVNNTWSRGRHIAVDNDSFVNVTSISPPLVEGVTRSGGSGYTIRDCSDPVGAFFWLDPDVFILCTGNSVNAATLYKTNMGAARPSLERGFSNWTDIDINGLVASKVGARMYITVNDENAYTFVDLPAGSLPSSFTIQAPFLSEVTQPNYSDRSAITGGSDRGSYFIGDPAIVNDPTDNINDRYVSVLSYDGGDYGQGAVLTYDRGDFSVKMASLGFESGGFPFGRAVKTSTGDYLFSVISARTSRFSGSILRYDSALGTLTSITTPNRVRPGISLAESAQGTLYGLGIDLFYKRYQLFSLDGATLTFQSLKDLDTTADVVPEYEVIMDNDHLWFFNDTRLYCYDTLTHQQYSYDFTTVGANVPVRAIAFKSAGGEGFFATRDNAMSGQGTIQRLSNNCTTPTISDAITGLTDLPSTALFSASDGHFYYGTQGGKLMRFDSTNDSTLQVADFGLTSVVGFLTEDSNGDIVGVVSDGSGHNDKLFAYTLSNSAVVTQVVPADKPIDTHYPGVTEIN
ncbi:REJ domain-containing protein [uncultured Shewanella sp.]|uniref:PKD domain-containing protein n=1 Tax=uncultured Shewanella sp. TaxID=173975 RepID=UPI00260D0F58|nr:REJ domain-containing protein [uncultured Shewanella sp.]